MAYHKSKAFAPIKKEGKCDGASAWEPLDGVSQKLRFCSYKKEGKWMVPALGNH